MTRRLSRTLAVLIPETTGVFDLYGFALLFVNRTAAYVDVTSWSEPVRVALFLVVVIGMGAPSISFLYECATVATTIVHGIVGVVGAWFDNLVAGLKADTAEHYARLAEANRRERRARKD